MKTMDIIAAIEQEMIVYFGDDTRRINHALKVLHYARQLNAEIQGDALTVECAAILHDIGIHEAEKKHHSSAGNYQEIEGPPIARSILARYPIADDTIDHIALIIANHHCAKNIDTPEFRMIWDADWLVNIPDEFDINDKNKMRSLLQIFKTQPGLTLAKKTFCLPMPETTGKGII